MYSRGRRSRRCTGCDRALALLVAAAAAFVAASCASYRCDSVAAFGNLGTEINSEFDDYAPALPDTSTILFTSNRVIPGRGGIREHARRVRPALLLSSMRLTASWDEAQPYPLLLGQPDVESATIALAPAGSPFGTVAYVSLCNAEGTVGGCDLYAVTSASRAALVNLGPEINSGGWDGQPAISPDGQRLYFASDRPGGAGGTDIWYSTRTGSGAWSAPINAGSTINSQEDELSPYILPSGSLLFVSVSPGRGRDIFQFDPESGARTALPSPYNSEADELTPFVLNGVLYLASNRPGGCGGYDLYAFAAAAIMTR